MLGFLTGKNLVLIHLHLPAPWRALSFGIRKKCFNGENLFGVRALKIAFQVATFLEISLADIFSTLKSIFFFHNYQFNFCCFLLLYFLHAFFERFCRLVLTHSAVYFWPCYCWSFVISIFFAQNFSNYLFLGLEAWTLVSKKQVSSHGVVLYGLGQSILVVLAFWWPFALFGPRSWSLNRSGHCNETLCQDLDWIHLPLFDWRRKILFILCIP